MQLVKALIDWSVTNLLISPTVLRNLELPNEPAFTSTQGLNRQLMMSAMESRKASLLVHDFEHLKVVDESEVLVIIMKLDDPVLGLPWCTARNQEIDWTQGPLTTQ
jgi:hypothetical protein